MNFNEKKFIRLVDDTNRSINSFVKINISKISAFTLSKRIRQQMKSNSIDSLSHSHFTSFSNKSLLKETNKPLKEKKRSKKFLMTDNLKNLSLFKLIMHRLTLSRLRIKLLSLANVSE
jgi:hypothetical protein